MCDAKTLNGGRRKIASRKSETKNGTQINVRLSLLSKMCDIQPPEKVAMKIKQELFQFLLKR